MISDKGGENEKGAEQDDGHGGPKEIVVGGIHLYQTGSVRTECDDGALCKGHRVGLGVVSCDDGRAEHYFPNASLYTGHWVHVSGILTLVEGGSLSLW